MKEYIVKRVFLAVVTIFVISAITFFAMNLIPGGPFNTEKALSPTVQKTLEERYNLDKPVYVQFGLYLKNLVHGDWGVSLKSGRDIWTDMWAKFQISAKLGGMAAIVAIIVGIVLGSVAALNRNKWPDRVIIFFTTLATAMPSFVLATLLLLVFCLQLEWVPVWSSSDPNYVLPVIALSLYPMAYITRLTKTSMLDALNQDYVRTARAKGVSTRRVIFKHALRNALIPVITYLGPQVAFTLCGGFVVESVFSIPGLGRYFVQSIQNRDYPVIMGTTIFLATFIILMNVVVDILYKVADPRISLGKGGE